MLENGLSKIQTCGIDVLGNKYIIPGFSEVTKTEFKNLSRSFHYCVPNSFIYIVDTLHFILIPHIFVCVFFFIF